MISGVDVVPWVLVDASPMTTVMRGLTAVTVIENPELYLTVAVPMVYQSTNEVNHW
jgi:hypothetical protein